MNRKAQEAPQMEVPMHIGWWLLFLALFLTLLAILGFKIIKPFLQ